MPKKRNIDLIAAIFMGAVSLVFWTQLKEINSPMDVIFPKSVLIVMFALCAILLIKAFTKPELKELFAIKNRNMVALGAVCLVVWVALLGVTGFISISVLAFTLLSWIMQDKQKRTVKSAINSVIVGSILIGLIYLVFVKLLLVPLPKGFLI